MAKLIALEIDPKIKLQKQAENFLNPDVIYMPVFDDKKHVKTIKKGDYVGNFYASISGTILGYKMMQYPDGKRVNCFAILNDFQEKEKKKLAARKKINHLTKEEILSCVFHEHLKQRMLSDVKTIVVSGIDDEPYMANELFVQQKYTKNLLEMIDAFLSIYPKSKAIIAIKSTASEVIEAYHNFLGTYTNITLQFVEDLYLIGKEEYLIKKLHIDDSYLYVRASELYEIYTNVKKRKPLSEKFITITGDAIENPLVINVKLGTRVSDIYQKFFKENISDYDCYVNGIMQGKELDISKLFVTYDFLGLVLMKKREIRPKKCIKCGKCISVCPIRSNPLLAYKTGEKVKCIHCGLCSYICPSHIPLRKYLGEENE